MSDSVGLSESERRLRTFAVLGAHERPLDWDRFYQFVISSHREGLGWDTGEVQIRLERLGMPANAAREYAEIYWHARCVLHCYDNSGAPKASYADWIGEQGTRLN
jgi:hypothetical protein